MSGHSKWATTHRKKAIIDSKRAASFTRVTKLITIAARDGADPGFNFKLRLAVDQARAAGMPKDNIERAVQRGAGGGAGEQLDHVLYEIFAPHGVAMLVEAATDNKNRTVSEIKAVLNKKGGSLGAMNSVAWQFEHVGHIEINRPVVGMTDEQLEQQIIESGANDYGMTDDAWHVLTAVEDLQAVQDHLAKLVPIADARLEYRAKEPLSLSDSDRQSLDVLVETIEEADDVTNVYTNVGA